MKLKNCRLSGAIFEYHWSMMRSSDQKEITVNKYYIGAQIGVKITIKMIKM